MNKQKILEYIEEDFYDFIKQNYTIEEAVGRTLIEYQRLLNEDISLKLLILKKISRLCTAEGIIIDELENRIKNN